MQVWFCQLYLKCLFTAVGDSPESTSSQMTSGKGSKAVSIQRGRCVCFVRNLLLYTACTCMWVDVWWVRVCGDGSG